MCYITLYRRTIERSLTLFVFLPPWKAMFYASLDASIKRLIMCLCGLWLCSSVARVFSATAIDIVWLGGGSREEMRGVNAKWTFGRFYCHYRA